MDLVRVILSALLFAAFIPGVLVKLPKNGSHQTVLVVHAVLFAVVTAIVMHLYQRCVVERFGNYGPTCPNGYAPGTNQGGQPDCVPTGRATYDPQGGFKANSPATK
jgi:hypothetical protein